MGSDRGRYDIFGKLTLPGDVTTNRATIVIGGQGEIVDFSDTPAHLISMITGEVHGFEFAIQRNPGHVTNQGAVELVVGASRRFHAGRAPTSRIRGPPKSTALS